MAGTGSTKDVATLEELRKALADNKVETIRFTDHIYLEGEYGESNICIGVPVVLGRTGWEKVIDFKLNDEETALFKASAEAVRKTNSALSL